tara:strand:- start:760 stop:1380 length:621 start_codon:yes stop_codon:yes gene_type:complete
MNYEKYWIDGMGLHSTQLEKIAQILKTGVKNVVEFGSGKSTEFLVDFREENELDYEICSFDHHPFYGYKETHDFLTTHRRDIVRCSDECYEEMFNEKKYNKSCFVNCQNEMDNFRIKNSFYDITEEYLPENIDLVILDGPNGNGRSISFLHLKDKLSKEAHILIDDSDHYDFVERSKKILDVEVIVHENDTSIHPLFNYALLKVTS